MNLGLCLIHQAPFVGYSPRKEEFLCKICVQRSTEGNPLIEILLVQQAIERVIQSLKKAVKNIREQINKEQVLDHYENCRWLHDNIVAKNLHADILKYQREWNGSIYNRILQGKVDTIDAKRLLIKLNFTNKKEVKAIVEQHMTQVFKVLATAVRQLRELLAKEDADNGLPQRDSEPFEQILNSRSAVFIEDEEDEFEVYVPVNIPSATPVIEAANVAMKKIIELKANAKLKRDDIVVNLPELKQNQQKFPHKKKQYFEQPNLNIQNALIREQRPAGRQQQAKRQTQTYPKHVVNKSFELDVSVEIQKPVASIPKELQRQSQKQHIEKIQSEQAYQQQPQKQPQRQPYKQPLEQSDKQQPQKQPSEQPYKLQQQSGQLQKQLSLQPYKQPSEQSYRQQSKQPYKQQQQKQPQWQPSGQPYKQSSLQPYKQQPQKQPQQQPLERPYNPSSVYPYRQPPEQSFRQPSDQPYKQPSDQPYRQPLEQPYKQPSDQPYKQPSQQSYKQQSQQLYKQSSEQSYNQQSQKQSQWQPSKQSYQQQSQKPSQQQLLGELRNQSSEHPYRPAPKQSQQQLLEQPYTQASKQSYIQPLEQSYKQQSQRQSQQQPSGQPYNASSEHLYKQPSKQSQWQLLEQEQKQLASGLSMDAIKEPIVKNTQAKSLLDDSSLIIQIDKRQYQQQAATSSVSKIQQIQRFQKTEVKKIEEPYESKVSNQTRKQFGQQKLTQQTTQQKIAPTSEQSKQASTIQLQKYPKYNLIEQPKPVESTNILRRPQQEYRKQSQLSLKQPLITHPIYEPPTYSQKTKPQLFIPSETKFQKPQLKRPEQTVKEAAPRQPSQLMGRQMEQQQNSEKPKKQIEQQKTEKQFQLKKQNQERLKRVQRARGIFETMSRLKLYCVGKEKKKGLQIIQNLPADYQKHTTLQKIKGKLLVDLNQQKEALEVYQYLVKALPTNSKVIFEKAVIQFNLGLHANSRKTIYAAKENSAEIWTLRGDLEFIDKCDKAQQFYRKAHELKPSSITNSRLAATQFRKGNFLNALIYIENARKLDPKCVQYINDQAFAEMRLKKLSDANRSMSTAAELQPNQPTYLNNLAIIRFKEEKLVQALELIQRAHKADTNDIRMFLNYAIIFQQVKKPEKTFELYKKYQNIFGDKVVFRLRMYQVGIRTNNTKIINEIYPQVFDLQNKNSDNVEANILICKVIAIIGDAKKHHNQGARSILANIIKNCKENASQLLETDARNCLAYLLKNVGSYKEASDQLKMMLPLNNPIILYNFAYCQYKCSHYNEALATLRKFDHMNSCPQNLMKKVVLMTLMIHMLLKKKYEAIIYLRSLNTNINIADKQFIIDLQAKLEQKR